MGWALLLFGLLFAPIVWAFTKGRKVREVTEDHDGVTGYLAMIKNRDWQGPHGSSGGSG